MNTDIAYLYVMRREGDQVRFVIDSDETDRQALPGKVYDQAAPTLLRGFTGLSVDDEIGSDEWGFFLSGYAPLKNGTGEYLIGIDMRADQVQAKYRQFRISAFSALAASVLLALLFGWRLAGRFMQPIRLLIDRCHAVAGGRFDEEVVIRTHDEFDQLVTAFNDMQAGLRKAEDEKRRAYEAVLQAREELEIRVRQRTADLKEVNAQLNREIAERMRMEKVLAEAAMTDSLTGLPNRRALQEELRRELDRARRCRSPLTALMVDLDSFKLVNDRHGHDAGDAVLVEAARRMKALVRGQDVPARWGGEEFVIVLPETPLAGGGVVAEKLRRRIADETFALPGASLELTASIGVATLAEGKTAEEMIAAADSALYRAKEGGRNRVSMAAD